MSLAASAVNKKPLLNKVMDVCIMLNNNPMHLEEKTKQQLQQYEMNIWATIYVTI